MTEWLPEWVLADPVPERIELMLAWVLDNWQVVLVLYLILVMSPVLAWLLYYRTHNELTFALNLAIGTGMFIYAYWGQHSMALYTSLLVGVAASTIAPVGDILAEKTQDWIDTWLG